MDASAQRGRYIGRANPEYVEGNFVSSSRSENEYKYQWIWTNTLSYTKKFGTDHKIDAYVGIESIREFGETFGASRQGYAFEINPIISYLDLGDPTTASNYGRAISDFSLYSQFGKVNYSFKDKYLVQGILRNDASSRFLSASQNAVFPAFSVGWRISEENFIKDNLPFINDMKIRYGWGKTGNQRIGDYNAYTTYRANIFNAGYPIDGSQSIPRIGYDAQAFGNPNAKWETTTSNNLGLDVTMLNNKMTVELDFWNRVTSDMLFSIPTNYAAGDANAPSFNVGQMTNKGLDLGLGYNDVAMGGDFRYSVSVNYSLYRNNVDRLAESDNTRLIGAGSRFGPITVSEAGKPISSFFGYNVLGIFQSDEEARAWPKYGDYNAAGKFKMEDVNGDGVITDADRTFIGSPHPDFNYGVNVNIGYKAFDLTLFGNGVVGNSVYNYVRGFSDFNTFQGNRSKRALYDAWQPSNTGGTVPIMDANDQISSRPSSYFIEDGTYFRLRNAQLTYALPSSLAAKIGLGAARVYIQGQNMITITNYTGLNPEIQTTNDGTLGFDGGFMPVSKNLIFGVNLSF